MSDNIELTVLYITETMKAYLIQEHEDAEEIWLPISKTSLTHSTGERGSVVTIDVPEWLATEKGLV